MADREYVVAGPEKVNLLDTADQDLIRVRVRGDTYDRFVLQGDGTYATGTGSAPPTQSGTTGASLPATATQAGSTAGGTPLTAIDITTAVAGKGKWRWVFGGANFGGVEDPVWYAGYNVGNGQVAAQAGEPVLSFNMEAQYNDSGVDTSEMYPSFSDTTGTIVARPFMFQMRRTPTRVVTDGVLNSTTTITSATAVFKATDVGVRITGTGIPAGTNIATYVSPTQVTLTQAATATASGVTLTISDINTVIRQSIFRGAPIQFQLPDNTTLATIVDGQFSASAGYSANQAIVATSNAGVPSFVLKDGGTTRFTIAAGNDLTTSMSIAATQMVQMSKNAGGTLLQFVFGSSSPWGMFTIDAAGTSASGNPILQTVSRAVVVSGQDHYIAMDSSHATLTRVDRNGYFMTRKVAAPADADVATSELAIWFDNTNGAGKAMFKGKTANGTVVTGSVTLT